MPTHILFAVVLEMFVYKEIEGAMEGWESCQTGLKWVKEREKVGWSQSHLWTWTKSGQLSPMFLEATDLGIPTHLVT